MTNSPYLNEPSSPTMEAMLAQLQEIVENFQASHEHDPELVQENEANVERKVQQEVKSLRASTDTESPPNGLSQQSGKTDSANLETSDQDVLPLQPLRLRNPLRPPFSNSQDSPPENGSSPRRTIRERRVQVEYLSQDLPSFLRIREQGHPQVVSVSDEESLSPEQTGFQNCAQLNSETSNGHGLSDECGMIGDGVLSVSQACTDDADTGKFDCKYPERQSSLRRPPQPYSGQTNGTEDCHGQPALSTQHFSLEEPEGEIKGYHQAISDAHQKMLTARSLPTDAKASLETGLRLGHRRNHATHRVVSENPSFSLPGDLFSTSLALKEAGNEVSSSGKTAESYTEGSTRDSARTSLFTYSSDSTLVVSRMTKIQTGSRETIKPLPNEECSTPHNKPARGISKFHLGRKKRHSISSNTLDFSGDVSSVSSTASSIDANGDTGTSSEPVTPPGPPLLPKPHKKSKGLSSMAAGLGGGYAPDSSPLTPTSPYSFKTPTGKELTIRRTPVSSSPTLGTCSTSSCTLSPPEAAALKFAQPRFPLDTKKKPIPDSGRAITARRERQTSDTIRKAKSKMALRRSSRQLSVSEQHEIRLSMQAAMRKAREKFLNDTGEAADKPLVPTSRIGPEFALPSPPPPMSVEAVKAGLSTHTGTAVSAPEHTSHSVESREEILPADTRPIVRLRSPETVSPFHSREKLNLRCAEKEDGAEKSKPLPEAVGEVSSDWEHPSYRKQPFEPWSLENSVFTKQELMVMAKIGRAPTGNAFANKKEQKDLRKAN